MHAHRSSPEAIKTLAAAYARAWNAHDLDAIMAMHDERTSYRMDGSARVYAGKSAVREVFAQQLEAVPDLALSVKSLFAGDEHVVFEVTLTGTRRDGTQLQMNGMDLITFEEGKIRDKNSFAVTAR